MNFLYFLNYKQKLFLSYCIYLFILIGAMVTFSYYNKESLRKSLSANFYEGAQTTYEEYLKQYVSLATKNIREQFNIIYKELNFMGDITQNLMDNEKELEQINLALNKIEEYRDEVENKLKTQSKVQHHDTLLILGKSDSKITNKTVNEVDQSLNSTRLQNLIFPFVYSNQTPTHSSKKYFYASSNPQSYVRIYPQLNNTIEYPGYLKTPYWQFFSEKLISSWKSELLKMKKKNKIRSLNTVIPPYKDALGQGIIFSFMRPIWNKERTQFEGGVAMDVTLVHLLDYIKDFQIADDGFAFIVNSEGNVISVGKKGEQFLGLKNIGHYTRKSFLNRDIYIRNLKESSIKEFADLQFPGDDKISIKSFKLPSLRGEYLLTLKKVISYESLSEKGLREKSLFVGLVVSKTGITKNLTKIYSNIAKNQNSSFYDFVIVAFLFFIISILISYSISKAMVKNIVLLSDAAKGVSHQNFDVSIPRLKGTDEVCQLSNHLQNMVVQIQNHTSKLENLNRLKNDFIARTSHELKTPLNGMIGMISAILVTPNSNLNLRVRSNLEIAILNGKRLLNLINDLLDLDQIQNNSLKLNIESVPISQKVDFVFSMIRPLIGKKDLVLENLIPSDVYVLADPQRLQQILFNLVHNAVKSTKAGKVSLISRIEEQNLVVMIQDSGKGISEKYLNRIFRANEKILDSSDLHEGTGLGLAITRQLLTLQNGEIWVDSTSGQGSKFFFQLPISHVPPKEEVLPPLPIQNEIGPEKDPKKNYLNVASSKIKIMIVDDTWDNLQMMKNYLSLLPYQIIEATSGFEALELMETEKPNLVLLDILMPDMDGYKVCSLIRERYSSEEVTIVFFSAKGKVNDIEYAYKIGANDFLTKPIFGTEVLYRVRSHIEGIITKKRITSLYLFANEIAQVDSSEDIVLKLFELLKEERFLELTILKSQKVVHSNVSTAGQKDELKSKNQVEVYNDENYLNLPIFEDWEISVKTLGSSKESDRSYLKNAVEQAKQILSSLEKIRSRSFSEISDLEKLIDVFKYINEIIYIEASNKYIDIYCESKPQPILGRVSLKLILQYFPEQFIQVNRSTIVKKTHVSRFKKDKTSLFIKVRERRINVSSKYQEEVLKLIQI